MHMADALISPAVGVTMWAVSAATIGYCSRKVKEDLDERKVPLMGVLGAFVFAAQMINFTIPATGSSGHLGGGMLLAILLGPCAAFLVSASVLVVQALFFADGGLLALGCNIFNVGFFPAFIAYPLIYKKIVKGEITKGQLALGATLAAVMGLQLGSFGVVLETLASMITELPFSTFVMFMQPIHLAIGLVEGIVTTAVVLFVWKASPQILGESLKNAPEGLKPIRSTLAILLATALITGGIISLYASENPDGLEWSMTKVSGMAALEGKDSIHSLFASIQEKIAFLPDYSFRTKAVAPEAGKEDHSARIGTSVSGIVGGAFVLLLAFIVGFTLKRFSTRGVQ
jgi:cobalt/nickel transport system permease protein